MKFPFLFLAMALAAGILFSFLFSFSAQTFFIASGVSLAIAWIFFFLFKKVNATFFFILLTIFFLGTTLFIHANKCYDENALQQFRPSSYADFYGTLYKSPSLGKNKDYLFLRVEKVSHGGKERNIAGNLRISLPHTSESQRLSNLLVHDKVKVSAQVSARNGFRNFDHLSRSMYFKSQNIHSRAFAKSSLLVERLESGSKISPLRWISYLRKKFREKIESHFRGAKPYTLSVQGGVLEALLLGDRGRMDESVTRSLQDAGLFHLFAISGAHIAIISFLIFSMLKILRVPTRPSYVILMIFLILYALLVEGRPSVFRATVMALAFIIGKLTWRDVNLLNTISVSAFLLLLINPFNLFSLGFQLTFAATFAIILFYPKIARLVPKLPLRISEIFSLSLTAQIGILPVIAAAFNRITFTSLVLNLASLPLVGLIMAAGYVFLIFSFLKPILGDLFAQGIGSLIDLLIAVAHLADKSFLIFRVPTPHLLTLIIYFVFLLLLLIPAKRMWKKHVLILCLAGTIAVLIVYPFSSRSENLKLTFIDVGQGESVLLELPGKKKMLIDGGGSFDDSFDIGERVVSPFLWRKGIKTIDFLVLTHAHPDHLKGLKAVVKNFQVKEFWESLSPWEDEDYQELRSRLRPMTVHKRLFRGQKFSIDNIVVEVLHPEEGEHVVPFIDNDKSLVIRLLYGNTSFLFTGDIGARPEADIIEKMREIRSHLLKSPHHGSASSSTTAFLEEVHPLLIVISVGAGNRYGFPDKAVLDRYEETGARVFRTDLHGAIEVTSDGENLFVRTATGEEWERRSLDIR